MKTLFFGILLGAAFGAGLVELKGKNPSQAIAYVSAADVAAALRKTGSSAKYGIRASHTQNRTTQNIEADYS